MSKKFPSLNETLQIGSELLDEYNKGYMVIANNVYMNKGAIKWDMCPHQ